MTTFVIDNQTDFGYPFSSACKPQATHFSMKWEKGSRPTINVPFEIHFEKVKATESGDLLPVSDFSDYVAFGRHNGILFKEVDIFVKIGEGQSYNGFGSFFEGGRPFLNLKKGGKTIAVFDGNVSKAFQKKKGRFIPTSNGGGMGITIVLLD